MSEVLSIFIFIFLAAFPGRTTFLLILLAASGNTKRIFIGAALAFLIQCLISVVMGQFLAQVPQAYVEIVAGLLFIYFSRKFWIESRRNLDVVRINQDHSIKSVFILIFAAEFGDVSQLAIVASASRASSKMTVFLLAVSAMWLITAVALMLGQKLKDYLKPELLQRAASLLFLALGLYLLGKNFFQF